MRLIPSLNEIVRALYGAFRLLRFDRGGLAFFEDSVEAFWRSFFAAVIVVPGHALFMGLRLAETTPGAGFFRIVIVEGLAYVTVWVAFPLALYYLCQAFGREERFIRTVVALNWATVLQIAIILPIDLLARSGLLPPPVGGFATFAATVYLFGYVWFVVRLALDVAPLPAAGVVVLDFMISSIVLLFAEAMLA